MKMGEAGSPCCMISAKRSPYRETKPLFFSNNLLKRFYKALRAVIMKLFNMDIAILFYNHSSACREQSSRQKSNASDGSAIWSYIHQSYAISWHALSNTAW